jgi:glycopeptide antibiotics resistance protein
LAAGLSTAIEGLQLFTADRVTSVADVMTNTTGALMGAVAAQIVGNASMRAIKAVRARAVDGTSFYP